MSVISQFFPSGGGSGGSAKMDLEVLILSGGGGAAITCAGGASSAVKSGLGGGGAVFVGSVPVTSGCTVPVVIGAGGAGATGEATTVSQNGTQGGSSSITTPETTLCVAGGGAGAITNPLAGLVFGSYPPTCPKATFVWNGGTGGTGGLRCSTNSPVDLFGIQTPGSCVVEGGRSIYSTGNFIGCETARGYAPGRCVSYKKFDGPHQINHKYGTFMGGSAAGGMLCCATSCWVNGQASGGAGGHGTLSSSQNSDTLLIRYGGAAYCSDITGTLEEYGRGVVHIPFACMPVLASGDANTGRGGSQASNANQCVNAGSGGSGVVVIRYPDQFTAAPASPGATDCSPVTPGYRTYRFNSTGSITLP